MTNYNHSKKQAHEARKEEIKELRKTLNESKQKNATTKTSKGSALQNKSKRA